MSQIPDLQAAVRALAGVEHAVVRWPEPEGPATLHVVLEAGVEREQVTRSVLETLRDVGGVDMSTLRFQVPPPPQIPDPPGAEVPGESAADAGAHLAETEAAPSSNGERRSRPVFSGLSVERSDLDNSVTVTLRIDDRTLTGRADGLATRRATPRTAAAAALLALRELLPANTRVQLDWLDVIDSTTPERPEVVQSAVTCLTPTGEQTFIGSAIVRDDMREAAVRATLDALNRRLEQIVPLAS